MLHIFPQNQTAFPTIRRCTFYKSN